MTIDEWCGEIDDLLVGQAVRQELEDCHFAPSQEIGGRLVFGRLGYLPQAFLGNGGVQC